MRQVYKNPVPPPELATSGYKADAVIRALFADQQGKCYVCEREAGTEFEVEHLKSQNNYPLLVNNWHNLFYACRYCNGKKQDDYDDILNPERDAIEHIIRQVYDPSTCKFLFSSSCSSKPVVKTIKLLELVFNGRGKMRTWREQQFLREFQDEFGAFIASVNAYLRTGSVASRNRVCRFLASDQEYLGFKRWFIADSPRLATEFADLIARPKETAVEESS